MKFNLKNVLLSVGMLVFSFVLVGAFTNTAEAATCTASAGNWATPGIWTCAHVPLPTDDVVIPSGIAVTINTAARANTVNFNAAAVNNSITIAAPGSLTVETTITIPATTVGGVTSTLAVADGTLSAGGVITITGSVTAGENSILSVATGGTITAAAGIAFAGTAGEAQLNATGTGTIILSGTTGTIGAGGTAGLAAGSTVKFTGTGAQTVPSYTPYGNLTIDNTGAATVAAGVFTIAGDLTVTAGSTLDLATSTPTVTGATSVTGTLTVSGANTKTFNGAVTINNLGTFSESAATALVFGNNLTIATGGTMTEFGAATVSIAGNLVDNGTYTASTGAHTFGGTLKTISGTAAAITIPSVSISVTITNSGTLVISTTLAGAGTLTNTGTLKFGGATITPTLTADSAGTVEYNAVGAQTVKGTAYYNLTLSGGGAKSMSAAADIGNNLTINDGATASLTGTASTANKLIVAGVTKTLGTWGPTTSTTATHKDNTIFTTGADVKITITTGGTAGNRSAGTTITYTPPVTTTAGVTTTPAATTPAPGCSSGNLYNTSTGALCVSAVAQTAIEGCANRNTGFSTSSGQSCVGNIVSAAATTGTYNFGSVTLRSGSQGSAVMELQRFLNANVNAGLTADGKFGPKTANAVKAWQAAHGLTADGLFGSMSRAKAE